MTWASLMKQLRYNTLDFVSTLQPNSDSSSQKRKSISTYAKPEFPWWQQQRLASPKCDQINDTSSLAKQKQTFLMLTLSLCKWTGFSYQTFSSSKGDLSKGRSRGVKIKPQQSEVEKGLWADSILLASPVGLFVGWPGRLVLSWWASLRGKPTRRGPTWGVLLPCEALCCPCVTSLSNVEGGGLHIVDRWVTFCFSERGKRGISPGTCENGKWGDAKGNT